MISKSVLQKAIELPVGFYTYSLGGSGYSGGDLPNSNYNYGNAIVLKRSSDSIIIILSGIDSAPLSINYYSGGRWLGWQKYVRTSDLGYVDCVVNTVANTTVYINGSPNERNFYIPVIIRHKSTNDVLENLFYDYSWKVFSNASQEITVRFYKYPA